MKMRDWITDWVYRWRRARALLHLGNAWHYMLKKNIASKRLAYLDQGLGYIDQGDVAAEGILSERFREMHHE